MAGKVGSGSAPPRRDAGRLAKDVQLRSMRAHQRVIQAGDACDFRSDEVSPLLGDGPLSAPVVVVSCATRQHDLLMGRGLGGAARKVADAAMRCVPPDGRPVTKVAQDQGREHLSAELRLAPPQVVITLGAVATRALLQADVPFASVVGTPFGLTEKKLLVATVNPMKGVRGSHVATVALRRACLLAKALVGQATGTALRIFSDV